MLTDLLLEQPLRRSPRTVFLQRLTAQISRIKWLVDALLKLSKLDSGTITMERKTRQLPIPDGALPSAALSADAAATNTLPGQRPVQRLLYRRPLLDDGGCWQYPEKLC